MHIGDAILKINNEDISDLTHDQVVTKLHDASGDQINLTIQHMNNMAIYLHLTIPKLRSSVAITQNSLTLPRTSAKIRRDQNRMSAEYPSECRSYVKQNRLSLRMADQQEVKNI